MAVPIQRSLHHTQNTQNFLTSRRLVDQLVDCTGVASGDLVLDIGAGRGIITQRLARRGAHVIAIEKDPVLASGLRQRFADVGNVRVHEGDFQDFRLPHAPYKVLTSIPFNVTTEIVSRLTAGPRLPLDAYLGMQREAAERFLGEPQGTLWAALLGPWFEASIVHRFQRADFTPRPQVDVVMLRLRKRGPPLVSERDAQRYRDFVTYCFTAWRPRLRDTLATLLGPRESRSAAKAAELTVRDTPSTIQPEQWLALFRACNAAGSCVFDRISSAEHKLRQRQRSLKKVHRTRTLIGGDRG